MIALLIATVVAAPLVEEVVFRGLMLRGLLSRMAVPRWPSSPRACCSAWPTSTRSGVSGNVGLVMILSAVGVAFGGAAYLLRASARRSSPTPSSTAS